MKLEKFGPRAGFKVGFVFCKNNENLMYCLKFINNLFYKSEKHETSTNWLIYLFI